jgi:hypothetical protein
MKRKRGLLLTFLLAMLSIHPITASSAESIPRLLLPVDNSDLNRLQSKSKYGLRQQIYFAKRYQIVRINFSVLDKPGQTFDVDAFPDLTMRMVAKSIAGPPSGDSLREWTGEIVSPALSRESGIDSPDLLHPSVAFWVHTDAQVPIAAAREIAKSQGTSPEALSALPDQDLPRARAFTKLNLRTLSGDWFVPALGAQFVIQPVEDDPRFHIIYEPDPDKVPQGTHGGNPLNEEKLRKAREFSDRLEREKRAEEEATRQR